MAAAEDEIHENKERRGDMIEGNEEQLNTGDKSQC
jgi:hypothetical protein